MYRSSFRAAHVDRNFEVRYYHLMEHLTDMVAGTCFFLSSLSIWYIRMSKFSPPVAATTDRGYTPCPAVSSSNNCIKTAGGLFDLNNIQLVGITTYIDSHNITRVAVGKVREGEHGNTIGRSCKGLVRFATQNANIVYLDDPVHFLQVGHGRGLIWRSLEHFFTLPPHWLPFLTHFDSAFLINGGSLSGWSIRRSSLA